MNKELLRAWVRELRSGKYQQGHKGILKMNDADGVDRYCCLGVLCEGVMGMEGRSVDSGLSDIQTYFFDQGNHLPGFETMKKVLGPKPPDIGPIRWRNPHVPFDVVEKVRPGWIDTLTPASLKSYAEDGNVVTLASLNDYYKFSFDEIASIIEIHFDL
jgi:hypothetical protein